MVPKTIMHFKIKNIHFDMLFKKKDFKLKCSLLKIDYLFEITNLLWFLFISDKALTGRPAHLNKKVLCWAGAVYLKKFCWGLRPFY